MTPSTPLTNLLTAARQRTISHLVLHQLMWTLTIVLACVAAILFIGSEYLSWLWLLLVGAASLGAGLWLIRKQFPSNYEVAQTLDARLHLKDSLSTAKHFSEDLGQADPAIANAQLVQAEELAQAVELKRAIPLTRPRALYPAIALAALVGGLFLVRYAVQGSFDPRPSLVKTAIDNFLSSPPKQEALNAPGKEGQTPGDENQEKTENKNADFAGDPQFDPTAPDPKPAEAEAKEIAEDKEKQDDKPGKDNDADKGDNGIKDDQSPDAKQADNQNNPGANPDAKQDPSMMAKMKQALNDLVNKLKQGENPAKNQKGEPPADAEKQPGQDGQSPEKNQGDSAEAQKDGQQSSEGENGKNAAQKKQSNDPQQGIGSQDGDKTAKDAAALKAMGKISELLGKRAENIKGSVTMEVGQTRQQLKTVESARTAQHAEAGSEIHRDQVPPAYEQYVQQYFEQVRRSTSTKTTPPPSVPK